MVSPQAARTCSIISGLRGSPAAITSFSATFQDFKSSWISIRHTVGGAQNVVTWQRAITSSKALALKRGWFSMKTQASAIHGVNTQLQACLAQPGEEMLR